MSSTPTVVPARTLARRSFAIRQERELPSDIFGRLGLHPQARHIHAQGSVASPAFGGGYIDVTGAQYEVPAGHFFAVTGLACLFDGAGFVQGSGNILWRLDVNQPVGITATTGHAVRGWDAVTMQHGSILMNLNIKELCNTLIENSGENFSAITTINEHLPDVTVDMLKSSLKEAFEKQLKVKLISDKPAKFELDLAKRLEEEKYSSREWNFRK